MKNQGFYRPLSRRRDGRSVIIRGIPPDDRGGMMEALDKVNSQLLYRRLFFGKRVFSAEEINRLTAVQEVRKWRQQGKLPFPDFTPETIAKINNRLEYPPPDSARGRKKEKE